MDWAYLFLRFDGRINRKPYWIATLLLIVPALALVFILYQFGHDRLVDIASLPFLYPVFALIIKRAHDRETPFWIVALYIILTVIESIFSIFGFAGSFEYPNTLYWIIELPNIAVAIYLIVDLGFRKGVHGPNRFGADPLERHS